MRRLFLDLDGVLSDFDSHYENLFGVRPNQDTYEPPELWDNIRAHGNFYRTQPLMPDALILWQGVAHLNPIVLTGVPYSIPNVREQKRAWVRQYIGVNVEVICCRSRDKNIFGRAGDVLLDDRLKYSRYWKEMGGVFVHHKSAKESLIYLSTLFEGINAVV